jgi:NADH:ubiquinone oxidoreductase subunit E
MKITVCIGSSCHLKGARQIVETLQTLIAENHLEKQVALCGAFCMGNCTNGVSVKLDGKPFSLQPETVKDFFANEVMKLAASGRQEQT